MAAEQLGTPQVLRIINQILGFIPNISVAIIILDIGAFLEKSLGSIVHGAAEVVATAARTAEVTVYNLSVDRFHTFFIGGAKLWVDNLKKSDPSDPPV